MGKYWISPGLHVGEKIGVSKERIKMPKLEMEHRFLYLVLKDILDGARVGITVHNCIVSPRLHSLVVDQPQVCHCIKLPLVI